MKMTMLIVTVIGIIVIPLGIYIYSRQTADIRYTLSDPIRISQTQEGKIWQQIEVRNQGNVQATGVQIKINVQIVSNEISKNSEADEPKVFSLEDSFELRYPILPPGGAFTLKLGTTKSEIELANISVLHTKGQGIEAFSQKPAIKQIAGSVLYILLGLLYLVATGHSLLMSKLEFNSKYHSESLLKKEKPFYIRDQRWSELRETALGKVLPSGDTSADDTSGTKSYRILCEGQLSYLSDDEWAKLRKAAEEAIKENLWRRINYAFDCEKLSLVVKLERPTNMLETTWMELQKKANERILEIMQRNLEWISLDKLSASLEEAIPEWMDQHTWGKHVVALQKKYVYEIERELYSSDKPNEFLQQQNLTRVSEADTSRLKDKAYRISIKQLPDLHRLEEAENFLKKTKPKWMTEDDHEKYTEIAQETADLKGLTKEYKEKTAVLEQEKAEVSKKILKVTSQLDIINQILRDPTVMDRIGEYNNAFAPGNFANLKKIAELIKQVEKTSQK